MSDKKASNENILNKQIKSFEKNENELKKYRNGLSKNKEILSIQNGLILKNIGKGIKSILT